MTVKRRRQTRCQYQGPGYKFPCARLGCSPAKHMDCCGHTVSAHGALGCEALTAGSSGFVACACGRPEVTA